MAGESIRQSRTVVVNGAPEVWILKWSGSVKPICPASELTQAVTCPCNGFAYGEQGRLFLDRKRDGKLLESMDLSGLFGGYDNPADEGNAALIRIPRSLNDPSDEIGDSDKMRRFEIDLQKRSPVDVMKFNDFSRDGMNASFLLQVGNSPCGKRQMVLVGLSRRLPYLHAFSTTAHPERPLVLQHGAWMALLAAGGRARFIDWACGDHGSENEVEQIIHSYDGIISVQANTYACGEDGSRGALLHSEER